MIPTRRLIRLIVRRFWGVCAFLLISLAVFVAIGRGLSPQLNRFKDDLAQYLGESVNAEMRIGRMEVDWSGLSPELRLHNVRIINAEGQNVMAMEDALLKVNLLRSLFNANLALDALQASEVAIDAAQADDGVWQIRGMPWQTTSQDNFNIDDPLDIFLLIGNVDFSNVNVNLTYRDGGTNALDFPKLLVSNSGDFHRLSSSIIVDQEREAVSLVVEFRGDPRDLENFSAKGYTRFAEVDVEQVVAAMPTQVQTQDPLWHNRVVTVESWFDVFSGGEVLFRGRLDLEEDELETNIENTSGINVPKNIGANFTGRLTSRGFWSVSIRDAVIDWEDFQAPIIDFEISSQNVLPQDELGENISPLEFRTSQLDLSHWLQALNHSGLLPAEAWDALAALNPRGNLYNVVVTLQPIIDSLPQFALQSNFQNFHIDSWRGTPIATNIKGFTSVESSQPNVVQGELVIDSQDDVTLQFPTLYENSLSLDYLFGQVNWQVNTESAEIDVFSGLLQADSPEGNARGYFDLFIPFKSGGDKKEELTLQLGVRGSEVKYYQNYVPSKKVPESLMSWLQSSIGGLGQVREGGFLYRGGLSTETFDDAAVQLYLDVANANLNYSEDWPPLTQASGQFWLDEETVLANVTTGKILESVVSTLTIATRKQGDDDILLVDGSLTGDARDGLQILRSEIFTKSIGGNFDDWRVSGNIQANLALEIPIQQSNDFGVHQVEVDLNGVILEMESLNIAVSEIHGKLHYTTDEFLAAELLMGQFLGRDVVATVKTSQKDEVVSIDVQGTNTIDSIVNWADMNFIQFAQGETDFDLNVSVPVQVTSIQNGGSGRDVGEVVNNRRAPTFSVRSNLHGVSIDLPDPYGKPAEASSALEITAPINGDDLLLSMNYENSIYGLFQLGRLGFRRGVITTDSEPFLPEKYQLLFAGQVEDIQFTEWQSTYETYFSDLGNQAGSSRPVPLAFDLDVKAFTFNDYQIDDLKISGDVGNNSTVVNAQSEKFTGTLKFDHRGPTARPVEVRLTEVYLPKPEKSAPTWEDLFYPPTESDDMLADIDPKTLPAIDFSVDNLFIGEQNFGSWSFLSRPVPTGFAITNLIGQFDEGELRGLEGSDGARLNWLSNNNGAQTFLEGTFVSSNLAGLIEKLDQPQLIQSESTEMDFSLQWPGSPTAMDINELAGEMRFTLDQGSFYRSGEQSPTGALLQIVSILNFDTWVRRLRLDFSDLGRSGLPFDQVAGYMQFDQGNILLDQPIIVDTQSGEFQLTGTVNLNNNVLDTKLIATLPMGGNLTFLTALAAGLPAAAGVWVVSKIFEEQIDKAATLSYTIEGPIQEPDIEFERLFDNKVGADTTAAQ